MEMTKTIKEIIKLLSNDCIIVQSVQDKYWIERNGEKIKTFSCNVFDLLKESKIITQSFGNVYCRFEFVLTDEFKPT